MLIPCIRCGEKINRPNSSNAYYVMAEDTIVKEGRDIFIALKHNQQTLDKLTKSKEMEVYLAEDGITELKRLRYPEMTILDSEYDTVKVPDIESGYAIVEVVKVLAKEEIQDVQKTRIVCPKCLKPTDTIIWGKRRSEVK